ncbi:unnamed protein product [Symbiodinium sp. CCMP2592]|nr:unnamed protein product [Symbiodinium sp. CCMP2592]
MTECHDLLEGWLRKKSHHIGLWKWRFFRFDGRILRYWKRRRLADQSQNPRAEISLSGCHVAAAYGCRFIIKAPLAAYDEELEADTLEQRDIWICSLNAAALQQRLLATSSAQVSAERFLQAKGVWQMLQDCVSASVPRDDAEAVSLESMALRYTRFGGALLHFAGEAQEPRQGRLVVAGRRVRDSFLGSRHPEANLISDAVSGAGKESWLLLLSSRAISETAGESQQVLGAVVLEPPRDTPLQFEALYAFHDPLDSSEPVASLPLLYCEVGDVAQCKHGSGWSLCIYEVDEACNLPSGASWLITVETREECELWCQAVKAARWAARAQAKGKKRAAEEALDSFDRSPVEWCQAAARRLKQVSGYAPPPPTLSAASRLRAWASPRTARLSLSLGAPGEGSAVSLSSTTVAGSWMSGAPSAGAGGVDAATEATRRVLAACEDVCLEAEGLLEAALAKRPFRQDAAGAALRCALVPAVATVGRCWTRWNADLPLSDARNLLRWLEARRQAACSLGLVCGPLQTPLAGLSSELSLRMGAHVRRLAAQLLVSELGERLRHGPGNTQPPKISRAPSLDKNSMSQCNMKAITSCLPVDFFTFVNSCLLDKEPGHPGWRLCSLRVAKFVIKEVQESLRGWLWATLPEVRSQHRETLLRRWFWGVSSLANAMPVFKQHCEDTAAHCRMQMRCYDTEEVDLQEPPESPETRSESSPVPREWRLDREEQDFEGILEALLWAACDVASTRWRRHVLSPSSTEPPQGYSLVPSLNQLLSPNLQVLREWLNTSLFELLLSKIFLVCMGTYVVKLSCGSWLQAIRTRDEQIHALSEEAVALCSYFAGLSHKPRGASEDVGLWEPGRVLNVLHTVLLSPAANARSRSPAQPRQAAQRRPPLPADWKSPLGFEDGLSKLVSVLSDSPLPLEDVLTWFSDIGPPGAKPFEELPQPVPAGALYQAAEEVRLRSRSSSMLSYNGSRVGDARRISVESIDMCETRSTGGLSLFGQAGRRESLNYTSPGTSLLMTSSEAAAQAVAQACASNSQAIGLASEGAVCDLRIEQDGAYGAFCEVSVSVEGPSDGQSDARSLEGREGPVLRWVQLMKASPQATPHFQLLEWQPQSIQEAVAAATPSAALSLTRLKEVQLPAAKSMSLVFSMEEGPACPRHLRYFVDFDCPSHAFRFRLVLESWWATEPIREPYPVVAYMGSGTGLVRTDDDEDGWRNLSPPLTRQVLELRLGGLWADVRRRLEAS